MAPDLFLSRIAGVKVRVAHSHNVKTEHRIIHALMRPIFEMSVTDRFACSVPAGKWLFHKKKFKVINNGIVIENYKPNLSVREKIRKKLGVLDNDILLVNVGIFNYQKNQEFLIELMDQMRKKILS